MPRCIFVFCYHISHVIVGQDDHLQDHVVHVMVFRSREESYESTQIDDTRALPCRDFANSYVCWETIMTFSAEHLCECAGGHLLRHIEHHAGLETQPCTSSSVQLVQSAHL